MRQAVSATVPIPSPFRLFVRIMLITFVVEGVVMLVLPSLPAGRTRLAAALMDSALLMLVTAPFLWSFVVRPLRGAALSQQARAAIVVANARDGIVTVDDAGVVEAFNPAAERILGYSAHEVIGRSAAMFAPGRYRPQYEQLLAARRDGDDPGPARNTFEVHAIRKDGTEIAIELSLATWKTRDGVFHTAVVRDITDRKCAENALRRRTQQLETVRVVAAEITRELELDVLLHLITRRAAELFDVQSGSVLMWDDKTQVLSLKARHGAADPATPAAVRLGEGFAGTVAKQRRGPMMAEAAPSSADARNATTALKRVGQPLQYRDRLLGVIVLSHEGTARQFTEQDHEMLGIFADQAAIAIENARLYDEVQSLAVLRERQRIARDIHDSLAQTLGLLHLQLRSVEGRDAGAASVGPVVADMTRVTQQAYAELRQLIFDLRTLAPAGTGWIARVREYVHEFAARTGVHITIEADDEAPSRLSAAGEIQALRIIQEALANVSRHALASMARVRVARGAACVHVAIEDDGRGFDPAGVTTAHHFGLATMRERAESLGGTLQIESAPGRGTRVVATLPARS